MQLACFGGSIDIIPFVPISKFKPPQLVASGGTPMGETILAAIKETEQHKRFIDRTEAPVRTPNYFVLTDGVAGSPPDIMAAAAAAIRQCEDDGSGAFYAFATDEQAVRLLQPLFPARCISWRIAISPSSSELFPFLCVGLARQRPVRGSTSRRSSMPSSVFWMTSNAMIKVYVADQEVALRPELAISSVRRGDRLFGSIRPAAT